MQEKISPHIQLAHRFWQDHLKEGDGAIDATCGNGQDTLFLCDLPLAYVIGIDIQPSAIQKTQTLLTEKQKKASLYQQCHSAWETIALPFAPRLIVYNLGYLPGSDKRLTTQLETTLQSIEKALVLLGEKGALSITLYPGHTEGAREEEALLDWAKALVSHEWIVSHHRWINRPRSPSLLWIVKRTRAC